MNSCKEPPRLNLPRKIRWHGRSYKAEYYLYLDKRKYYIVKSLSSKRQRYMVFDDQAGPQGDMRCIIGIDGRNLSTKLQPPGLVEKLKRLSQGNSNLPAIISYHSFKGCVYLVTPWIEGDNLESYLQHSQQKISPREACLLIRGLAHSLRQMHAINIVHGDLNPGNLILQRNPNRLVMIDFGSAWLVENTTTRDKGDGIRPKFAAPELYLQKPFADFRSDQFSLGVLLYWMLTGDIPYEEYGGKAVDPRYRDQINYKNPSSCSPYHNTLPREAWLHIKLQIIDRITRRFLQLDIDNKYPNDQDLPREAWLLIDRITRRCLQLDIDNRYPNDQELLDDLDDLKEALRPKRLSMVNEMFLRPLNWFNQRWRKN